MESTHEPADPIAKGILATAKQSWHDLFIFKQRVVVTNELGETRTEWARPVPLRNPVSLLAQLSARNWLFFIVGFLAWVADAFDFRTLKLPSTLKRATPHDIDSPVLELGTQMLLT